MARRQGQSGRAAIVGKGDFKQSAFQLDETNELKLVAYNFGDKPARGKLSIEAATAAKSEIELARALARNRLIKANGKAR